MLQHKTFILGSAAVALLLGLLTWIGTGAADTVLHEFFVVPAQDRAAPLEDSPGGEGAGDQAPPEGLSDALRQDDPSLPPPLSIENSGDEMEVGADGAASSPNGEPLPEHNGPLATEDLARPDRQTTLDSELTYFSVFNPSVVPWKRTASRDEVHADYSLGVRDKRTYELKVKDRPERADHERFWGSVLVQMEAGQKIPLPSVSPQAEILRYQTEPRAFVQFHRDMADNFYVSAQYNGPLRINYLMEAHRGYFGGEVDPELRVEELERRLRPKLPPRVREAAEEILDAIGVNRDAPFREQLGLLVSYFRSFEARDFPSDQASQDIYKDLALSKLGVCRHRAFAFVVTAQAAGILARYIHNEAHAFVEVLVPRRGWLRIDLGGAAADFDVRNTSDKVLHNPPEEDALPQPEGFTESYSHRLGRGNPSADIDADGQSEEIIDGVPNNLDRAEPSPGDLPQGLDEEASQEVEPGQGEPGAAPSGPQLDFPDPAREAFLEEEPQGEPPRLRPTQLRVMQVTPGRGGDKRLRSAFRGDPLRVTGKLVSEEGLALQGQEVSAFLVPRGEYQPEKFQLLGKGQTNAQGEVEIEVKIPETVSLGPWSIYLYFSGSGEFQKSHSP